jgi:predicted aminopeptidase
VNSSSILAALRALTLGVLCVGASGCYLMQSAAGELALLSRRVPIQRVIADPATPDGTRKQLEAVTAIRTFAVTDLGLPDNGSYRSYANLRREYAVWTVVAAPELSVEPREWCYPFVGCVAYRGYFVERRAEHFAATLERGGYDVDLTGVAAYSTLGHFDDPVLNTMLGWSDVELASIIFHELTHQLIYIPGDADFDEALAVTVEQEGVRRWLSAQHRRQDLAHYELEQQRYSEVVALIEQTRARLKSLYAAPSTEASKREGKRAEFAALRAAYQRLKEGWGGGKAPFDGWFAGEINNAYIASVATYFRCVPGFKRELAAVEGSLPAFYQRVRTLAKLDPPARDAQLCTAATAGAALRPAPNVG